MAHGYPVQPLSVRFKDRMLRQSLISTVASFPLLLGFALPAAAETTVTTERTTQIATATANSGAADNVTIATNGSIKLSAAGIAAFANSSNSLTNSGSILINNLDNSTGMQALGGFTGSLSNLSSISVIEDYTAKDTDSDGDLDGAFATGTGRYGMRLVGPGTYTGTIKQGTAGSITVEGNNSFGISLETAIVGDVLSQGAITITGDNARAISLTGDVTGKTTIEGTVGALGLNAVALDVQSTLTGPLVIQGTVSASGYRYTSRPALKSDRDKLDSDDLLQGGPAIRIAGSVTGGILFDAPPADLSSTNTDEDADGVADSLEATASISVFGQAPAVLIGSDTQAITIGTVGTTGFGLFQKGLISASGQFDGVSAHGIQIGGNTGQSTTISGGISLQGSVTTEAHEANAVGIALMSGASTPLLNIKGTLNTGSTTELTGQTVGVLINAGATLPSLTLGGTIATGVAGEKSDVYGIRDLSGTLTSIQTTGRITSVVTATDDALDTDDADLLAGNEIITGQAIAIDVAANTTGLTLVQNGLTDGDDGNDGIADPDADGDGVDDADEPVIIGAIKLGSGADTLDLRNGFVVGDISFGAGADSLIMTGGAVVTGKLTDSDGQLSVAVTNGVLTNTSSDTLTTTSLSVGASGTLVVTADPANNKIGSFTTQTASLASGAKIGVTFKSLLPDATRYTVIQATSLTAGTLDQSLLGNTPFLYVSSATADTSAGAVYLDVRRRTATEMGLNAVQTSGLNAVYAALNSDTGVRDAFLAAQTRSNFVNLYDQMLPDQGESLFSAMDQTNRAIGQAIAARPDPRKRYGPDSFWVQEINGRVQRSPDDGPKSKATTFGFVGGYESMGDGGALGLTLAYVNVEERGQAASVGEQTTTSNLSAGAYWREYKGNWIFAARGSAGYSWMDGSRRLLAVGDSNNDGIADITTLSRTNRSKWSGYTAMAGASAAYEWRSGKIYVKPSLALDYLYINESDRSESGGGSAFDLKIDSRTSSRLAGSALISVGADFGRDLWWRPELHVGYRQNLAGELGNTVARFAGGNPFTLVSNNQEDGAILAGFSIKAGTPMSYLALEGDAEISDSELRYLLQLYGRVMF
jgi:hypothetical protein